MRGAKAGGTTKRPFVLQIMDWGVFYYLHTEVQHVGYQSHS